MEPGEWILHGLGRAARGQPSLFAGSGGCFIYASVCRESEEFVVYKKGREVYN